MVEIINLVVSVAGLIVSSICLYKVRKIIRIVKATAKGSFNLTATAKGTVLHALDKK